MSRLFAITLLASLIGPIWGAPPARAEDPVLQLRARLRIDLARVEPTRRGLVVSGTIIEESTSDPFPGHTVALEVKQLRADGTASDHYSEAKPTSADGEFKFEVGRVGPWRYSVRLTAQGDHVYAAPQAVERTIDLGKRTIELRLGAAPEHPATIPLLPIKLDAVALEQEQGVGEALPVELELDGKAMATVMVRDTVVETTLPLPAKITGGEIVVRARFAGDERRGPAEASARVKIVEPVKLELSAERGRVNAAEEVALSGHLRTGARPLAATTVLVRRIASAEEPEDAPFVAVKTDTDGSFRAKLRAPARAGRASFEASLTGPEAKLRGVAPASSEIVVVEVLPGMSVALASRRPAAIALAIAAALVLALGLQRALRVLAARRARARTDGVEPTEAPPKRLFATLRMPSDRRVAGRVRDAERGTPLAGAGLLLRVGDHQSHVVTDEHGAFAFPESPAGAVSLTCEHEGHAPLRRAGQVPHRGELAALELQLMPLRGEVLRRYDVALHPFSGGEHLGRVTPRELADAALRAKARGLPKDTVVLLRKIVEERCFSGRAIDAAVLSEVERLIAQIPPPPP